MLVQSKAKFYTPDEYRELEETAEFRNEYRDGEIAVSYTHLTLPTNREV